MKKRLLSWGGLALFCSPVVVPLAFLLPPDVLLPALGISAAMFAALGAGIWMLNQAEKP